MRAHTLIANLTILLLCATASHAQILAIQSANAGSVVAQPADTTYGWRFTLGGTALSVSELGVFDRLQDGLVESHTVGIWDSSGGTPLTQAIVPSGTAGTLSGSYRFVSVSPVTLNASQTYYIGGWSLNGTDEVIVYSSESFATQISYETATLAPGNGFAFPGSTASLTQGAFGPNFSFSAVPEPHEYALVMGFGLVAFVFVRNRLSRRTEPAKA